MNEYHGFRHLENERFENVLGFGSAYGYEFYPIMDRIGKVTIVEPSGQLTQDNVFGTPVRYVKPSLDGTLPFGSGQFDLVTCLDVLHHIPNVSYVVKELGRVTVKRGYIVLREPVISMGDWRQHRKGLTSRERGIPEKLLTKMLDDAGFKIKSSSYSYFPPIPRLCAKLGIEAFNSRLATRIDAAISKLTRWNLRYHATTLSQKLRPTMKFYVASKDT